MARSLVALFLILISVSISSSQAPAPQQQRGKNGAPSSNSGPAPSQELAVKPSSGREVSDHDTPINLAVDLVVLDALVLHQKTGAPAGNLKISDFALQEDGARQEITHFTQDTLPLSVIFLIDRGGCMDPFSEKVRRATQDTLARFKPEDEAALMSFDDTTDLLIGFTTHHERIMQGLDRLPPHREEASHCFSEAFYRAAEYMRQAGNPDGRRVIVVLTAVTSHFDCGGHSSEQARQAVLESGSVVCGIIPKTPAQRIESGIMRATTGLGGIFKAPTFNLKQLTEETGGEILSDKPQYLDQTFRALIDHLRTRYTIGFVSTNTRRDGSFRKLKLDVVQPGQGPDKLVVRTRRGYYASRSKR
jgi:VWFA-related protein